MQTFEVADALYHKRMASRDLIRYTLIAPIAQRLKEAGKI
jgi:hypothetical protein